MGEWLKGRRNALIDAALVYVVAEWVAPAVISTMLYLGSSAAGVAVLFAVIHLLLLGSAVLVAIRLEPTAPDPPREEGKLVYFPRPPPMPFMLGGRANWVRYPAQPDAKTACDAAVPET